MGLSKPLPDQSSVFNSVYNITLDMSNYDKTVLQLVAPMTNSVWVYGSNDDGSSIGSVQGNAELATNFNVINDVVNLATGTVVNPIVAAGSYKITVNNQFLRLQGTPAAAGTNIYKILFFHSKVS